MGRRSAQMGNGCVGGGSFNTKGHKERRDGMDRNTKGGESPRAVGITNFAGVMAVGREPGGPAADHRAARVMRGG